MGINLIFMDPQVAYAQHWLGDHALFGRLPDMSRAYVPIQNAQMHVNAFNAMGARYRLEAVLDTYHANGNALLLYHHN